MDCSFGCAAISDFTGTPPNDWWTSFPLPNDKLFISAKLASPVDGLLPIEVEDNWLTNCKTALWFALSS